MAILNVQINEAGQSGVVPRLVRIDTDNTRAEVIATGYLNNLVKKERVALLPSDIAVVTTRATPNATAINTDWYDVVKSGDNWSLVASNSQVSLADGNIFVGDANGIAQGVTMSGDATIANTGALTIANLAVETAMLAADAVTNAKLADNAVSLENLDSGITPSHIVVFAGQPTTAGGGAAEAITVTGALATDLAFVQMVDDGTNNVTIVNAVVTADTLTVTFSGDPGNDAVINYQLIRAAA